MHIHHYQLLSCNKQLHQNTSYTKASFKVSNYNYNTITDMVHHGVAIMQAPRFVSDRVESL